MASIPEAAAMRSPSNGRLTAVTDPLGRVTRYRYDAGGRLVAVEPAERNWTVFEVTAASEFIPPPI